MAPAAGDTESGSAAACTPLAVRTGSDPRPTLQMLFGVQRSATAAPAEDQAHVHDAAARGTATASSRLPFADQIQRAFGRHDIAGIQAHAGGEAAASAHAMGARAYATGAHVVLGEGADLHTVAHEAAHVVQQRGGVQLKGGVGEVGDAYERHADEVADRVTRGESAEALLDQYAGAGGSAAAPAAAIQRKPSDFVSEFGGHPQMNLPIEKQIQRPGWNAYVINVKPYFKIDDDDLDKQTSWLQVVTSRERPLREDALQESRKKESQDQFKAFSPNQLELAIQIGKRFELEKEEVFGTGRLRVQEGVPSHRVEDKNLKISNNPKVETPYVDHEDPSGPFGANKLFRDKPAMEDVQQGNLGDCYLLAAVASIVHEDPDHFPGHMRDNLDGTVTVQFYTAVATPLYITVHKSVVGNQFARNVLWVKLLEKAYVASGLKNKTVGQGGDRLYKDIAGGSPDQALLHLTGRAAETFTLGRGRKQFQDKTPELGMEAVKEIRKQIEVIGVEQDQIIKAIKEKQLKDKQANVDAEKQTLQKLDEQVTALMKQWKAVEAPRLELEDMLTRLYVSRQSFKKFLEKHQDNEVLVESVKKAKLDEDSLPGELGSGIYGKDERAAFIRIQAAIDAHKPITASTKRMISDPDNQEEQEKGLAGEAKVSGLASAHAYTVLDYAPRLQLYLNEQIKIKLRNPWGSYGRKYEKVLGKVKGVADSGGNGVFWIDLADLVAYFDDLAISG